MAAAFATGQHGGKSGCEVTDYDAARRHNFTYTTHHQGTTMYDNLKSLRINHLDDIDLYSLCQEANNDILKIYFRRDKGEFLPKALNSNIPST